MKLRKCICGTPPKHYPFDDSGAYADELSHIYYPKCDLSTMSFWSGNKAMQSWNLIIREKQNEN
jgi:hypothetical protein